MSVSEDLINFDIIETQKENIQSLPQGRSAKALASAFAPSPFSPVPTPGATRNLNDTLRAEYELELQTINDSDDPLDVYDRYIKWTFNAYPTAQATPESQLRPLLERATKAFQSTPTYKNDPRYLKLWLHYIRLFSDAPREVFAYLSRHGIGDGLALYYEEFAAWLEGAGRWHQAEEIYKLGIEREARPSERLLRKFGEFQKRLEARPANSDEPSSPALPTVRPALAAKLDPYAAASGQPEDPQAQRLPSASSTSRNARQKIAIFSDADGSLAGKPESSDGSKGWDNIGSIQDRKKENSIAPKAWAGETLKSGKRVGTAPKMSIFRDQSASDMNSIANGPNLQESLSPLVSLQETENAKTGKLERIYVNLTTTYPNAVEERCFEEVMAVRRGWKSRDWSKEQEPYTCSKQPKSRTELSLENDAMKDIRDLDVTSDITSRDLTLSDITQDVTKDGTKNKPRRKKTMEVRGETQTIKLNLSSPSVVKKIRRKSTAEPTMTLHSRAATDEVLDMFNQTLRNVGSITETPESLNDSDYDDDDYTSGGESTGTAPGHLSANASEYGDETEAFDNTSRLPNEEHTESDSISPWSDFTKSKHVPRPSEIDTSTSIGQDDSDVKTPDGPESSEGLGSQFLSSPPSGFQAPTGTYRNVEQMNQNRLPFMTPIVEMTESSVSMPSTRRSADYFNSKTPSRRRHDGDLAVPDLEDILLDENTADFQQLSRVEEETVADQLIDLGEPTKEFEEENPQTREMDDGLSSLGSGMYDAIAFQEKTEQSISADSDKAAAQEVTTALQEFSMLDLQAESQNVAAVSSTETIGRLDRDVVIFDDHVNPIDEDMRKKIIKTLDPALSTYPGFHDHTPLSSNIKSDLEKLTRSLTKRSKSISEKTNNIESDPVLMISENETATVKQLLGRGGWASVYLTEMKSNNTDVGLQAMKSEFSPSSWEYSLMVQTQARLTHCPQVTSRRSAGSIAKPLAFHSYEDAGYLFESFHDQGTLLDLVNKIKADALPAGSNAGASNPGIDEHMAMFFAVEILRTVSDMHSVGVLHCDIKADNFLVRLDPIDESEQEWNPVYSADGENGWYAKGIVLIDFGRAIDTLAFKPDTCFYAEWATDKHDCPEQREARPWTYQADLWGVASIFSVLLFGKVLEETIATEPSEPTAALPIGSSSSSSKRYRPRDTFKRYWKTELWTEIFDVLMNPSYHATQSERVGRGTGGMKGLPATKLKAIREQMEQFLVENAERKGLKQGLKKLEEKLGISAHGLSKKR